MRTKRNHPPALEKLPKFDTPIDQEELDKLTQEILAQAQQQFPGHSNSRAANPRDSTETEM